MAIKKLITLDDIMRYRPLAKAIPVERIDTFISEAQEIDLLNVLGSELFYDFMNKYDNSVDIDYTKYQELLKGKVYTPPGGQAIEYNGLIPMLSYFSLARFCQDNPINITRYGIVKKITDESEAVDARTLQAAVDGLRSIGINYQTRVIKFLQDNATSYTLYNTKKEVLNTNGVKFFDV